MLAAAATATISVRDPVVAWSYCLGIFLLAGYGAVGMALRPQPVALTLPGVCLVICLGLISLWGFGQLAAGATVYRYATWDAALRTAALGATAFAASQTLAHPRLRRVFVSGFAWFGAAVSLLSVAAYFTSPGRVLWVFPSPYPDVWGPFLSRNDFAGFLELSLPAALWRSLSPAPPAPRMPLRVPARRMPLWIPAWMLAAGLASASRAGAAVLVLEAAAILVIYRRRSRALRFTALVLVLAALSGADR